MQKKIFLCFFLFISVSVTLLAQVEPLEEKGKRQNLRDNNIICNGGITYGYPPSSYPSDTSIETHHKDVVGVWLIAPTSGRIDSIFVQMGNTIGAKDSVIYCRVHRSNVYVGSGPGNGIYPSPPTPWGFFYNTNDLDQGIASFPEDATTDEWISTITPTSFPPFNNELWGLGGFPIYVLPNSVGKCAISELPLPLQVQAG
ncbi:MAG: hypothetical protein EPO24_14280, partial [Bacteroidetes bacterium]